MSPTLSIYRRWRPHGLTHVNRASSVYLQFLPTAWPVYAARSNDSVFALTAEERLPRERGHYSPCNLESKLKPWLSNGGISFIVRGSAFEHAGRVFSTVFRQRVSSSDISRYTRRVYRSIVPSGTTRQQLAVTRENSRRTSRRSVSPVK